MPGLAAALRVVDRAQGDVADRLVADPLVDDVAPDEDLAGPRLERVEVDVPAAQAQPVALQVGEAVGVDEDPPPLALGDEADDPRRLARRGRDGDDVLDAADRRAPCVKQRQPHDAERLDQLAGHAAEPTPGPGQGQVSGR